MIFSSIPFLFYFLPITVVLYFVLPKSLRNLELLLASLVFYAWGEPKYVLLMAGSIIVSYIFSLFIGRCEKRCKKAKLLLFIAVALNVLALGVFKYTDFVLAGINSILSLDITLPGIALPVGISFYTFQSLSYCVDVYRGDVPPQKNIINFAAYITMFPQLIAGPIVRYKDINEQLSCRTYSFDKFYSGLSRFIIGLAKKVLIANQLGELCSFYKATEQPTILFTWLYAIAYALHVYFDFSGYSCMAIGLGKIFGFEFLENFNYPYISKTATEFWRRWHMSLGTWFRDYVYIPMGGNRVPFGRWILNTFTVWALTGLWHGASMSFVVWGLYFAVLLVIEKLFLKKFLEKLPTFISHIYLLLMVFISFMIFDSETFSVAGDRIAFLFGGGDIAFSSAETMYYLKSYAVTFIVGIIGAMPIAKLYRKKFGERTVIETVLLAILLVIVVAYLVDGSYNPFLYFRF